MSEPERAFVADRMLGKLARMLRMLGQDVVWFPDASRDEVMASAQARVLLTRDRKLAAAVPQSLFIEHAYPYHQARQVLRAFSIRDDQAFTRCVEDNGRLAPVSAEVVRGEVPSRLMETEVALWRCTHCQKVYWSGSHVDHMRTTILELVDAPIPDDDHAGAVDDGPALGRLEPLLDTHQALDALLWSHRVALLKDNLPRALGQLRRFAMSMVRHLQLEEDCVLPPYRACPPADGFPRGGSPEIFERDHEKIRDDLANFERRCEALEALRGQARDLARLSLLDAQRKYVDLLAHHDHRERMWLYPRLVEILSVTEQEELLRRFGAPLVVANSGASE